MSLEAPKGFIEPDETPQQAALRELAEETGLSCPPANLIEFGTVAPEPGIIKGRLALFAALDCGGTTGSMPRNSACYRSACSPVAIDAEIGAERVQDAVTLLLLCRHRALKEV